LITGRERILAHLAAKPVDSLPAMPITMMFAADTIGAPYRAYASDYRVMAEAQIRTAETYGFDYVSSISDPAREASDLGAAVEWFDDQPPALNETRALLAAKSALDKLAVPDPLAGPRMRDRIEAVRLLRSSAGDRFLVEGWVEGPCAMGADLRGLNTLMLDFTDDPQFVTRLFEFVVEMELRFARAQVDAGADLIGVGDAASSLIGPRRYREFVLAHEQRLIAGIQAMGALTRLHICGNTRRILADMASCRCDIVDIDYFTPVAEARAAMGPAQVLLGNIDPVRALRDSTPGAVFAAMAACHAAAGSRWIAGAGCEVPRGTPPENIRALVRYAREHTNHAS
jgi:MtaA/CmuA family methyltransferase